MVLTKEQSKMMEDAKKQIEEANSQTENFQQPVVLERDYKKYRIIFSAADWCLLTNDKKLLVVERLQPSNSEARLGFTSGGVRSYFIKEKDVSYWKASELESKEFKDYSEAFYKEDSELIK
jgi:hypothetical protein